MRVHTIRIWFSARVESGLGAARKAGLAVTRRMRAALGKVEASAGVGDEETAVGRHGSRAWLELIEETVEKIRRVFDQSSFVRLSRFEGFMRNLLGLAPKAPPPPPPAPKPQPLRRSLPPAPVDPDQVARFREQVQRGRMQAQTGGSLTAPKREETKVVWPGPGGGPEEPPQGQP